MIRHNWPWKLLALALSILLWSYVNAQRYPKANKTITMPIQTMNLAKGYVADISTQQVNVEIQGLKAVVDTIRQNDVYAWVDLDGVTPSEGPIEKTFTVNTRIAGFSSDELSYSAIPKTVRVRVEMIGGKRLPVEVKFLSAPPLGYSFGNPVLNPASVSVSGKSANIQRVKKVVMAVPQSSSNSSIDEEFSLVPMDEKGAEVKGVVLSPSRVRLQVNLLEVPTSKQVLVSYKVEGKPKSPAKLSDVTVEPSSIRLEGRPNILADISTVETEPINLEGIDKSFTKKVKLILPDGVKTKDPATVTVTVNIE